ncbi:MAG TPA: hypothetical protein VGQ94_04400 [Terriglobales bacterium]|nr:hypothetical protein [Terriglobales bacterium]
MAIALAIAAIRVAIIFYQRYTEKSATAERPPEQPLNPDYYVVPHKLYAYDLRSAQKLVGRPVWVRAGYRSAYFPCEPARLHCDFRQEAGLLGPIQRLEVKDVIRLSSPLAPGQPQIMVVFEKEGKSYAFSVGAMTGENYTLFIDDMLYLQDPHQLYRHWPAEVWQAVDQHQIHKGMNELQVTFSLGTGYLHGGGQGSTRVLTFPNGGKPLVVTLEQDKVVDVEPAPPGS